MNRSARENSDEFWDKSLVLQAFQGHLLSASGHLKFLNPQTMRDQSNRIYLGEIQDQHYFVSHSEINVGGSTLRELSPTLDTTELELAVTALALTNWHETHTHCPRCGAQTVITKNGWVRECIVDKSQHFPRTDPAIIVAVQDRSGRICLGRQASWIEGRYSNFAGFVEPGESLEDAVIREVAEESGLKVREIKYLSSQPWPFPNSIMLAFEAFTDDPDEAKPDGEEIVDLKWFTKSELLADVASGALNLPPITSVSRKMIEGWLNDKR